MNNIFHWCLCYSGLQIMFPMQKINFIVYDQVSNGDTDMYILKKKVCTKLGNFSVSFFHLQFKFTDIVYCCAPLLTAFHEGYQVNKWLALWCLLAENLQKHSIQVY